ncbi:MAG: flocculation-associated PEP-CTERM protein PepA, partial [Gemmataceae bacterium]
MDWHMPCIILHEIQPRQCRCKGDSMKLRTLCSAAALAVGFAGSAMAFPQFTVDESAYGGSSAVNANQFGFGYSTQISLTSATTFSEIGGIEFNALENNSASAILGSKLGASGNYLIVGNLTATGSFTTGTTTHGTPDLTATFANMSLSLYLVPSADFGTLAQNANGTWSGITANELLATANLNSQTTSNATLITCSAGSTACGDWSINAKINTPTNSLFSSYFTKPTDFYIDLGSTGNNSPPIALASPIRDIGSGNAYFAVPEPA